jgi:hypothetical protein
MSHKLRIDLVSAVFRSSLGGERLALPVRELLSLLLQSRWCASCNGCVLASIELFITDQSVEVFILTVCLQEKRCYDHTSDAPDAPEASGSRPDLFGCISLLFHGNGWEQGFLSRWWWG